MTDADGEKMVPVDNRWRRIQISAVVLVVVFLLGLVPMWLVARSRAAELDEARRQLRICSIRSSLSSAAIDARNGDYEPARQEASSFFTELGTELDKGSESVFEQSQRENLKPLLAPRDELITLLARSDPAAADRLNASYVAFRKALGTGTEKH